jgi:6 kDa early secretory antigenic target
MSDGLLRVNFGALSQASADIQKAVNELETQLAELDAAARPLVATWEGGAQQAYASRQQRWTNASGDLKSILRGIKGAVDQAAQDYALTEGNAEKRFLA